MTEKSEANLLPAFCKKDQNIQRVEKNAYFMWQYKTCIFSGFWPPFQATYKKNSLGFRLVQVWHIWKWV